MNPNLNRHIYIKEYATNMQAFKKCKICIIGKNEFNNSNMNFAQQNLYSRSPQKQGCISLDI